MSALKDRYASSQILEIWSHQTKVMTERIVWIEILKSQIDLGLKVDRSVVADYERVISVIDLERISKREISLKHDVKARIEEFNFLAGHEFIHVGLTSRDITENVEAWQIRMSIELVLSEIELVLREFSKVIDNYAELLIVGRTHNVPAQLTTLGRRFASWAEELLFAYENLKEIHLRLPMKGIKGAIGTGADLREVVGSEWNEIERSVAKNLEIENLLIAPSQIYPRSLDFEVIASLVQVAAPLSTAALNIRLMSGLGLTFEGKSKNQVGSSAMPHKNNPRLCERVNGLFSVLRGFLVMSSEISGNQWFEGDVSDSVVRRLVLPESFYALDGILRTTAKIFREMEVDNEAIAKEIEQVLDDLLSSKLMMLAFQKGVGREVSHRLISECSTRAKRAKNPSFVNLVAQTPDLKISLEEIEKLRLDAINQKGDAPLQARRIMQVIRSKLGIIGNANIIVDEVLN